MQELIDRVAAAAGIDVALAEKSIGLILGFLKSEAPAAEMGQLLDALPGMPYSWSFSKTPVRFGSFESVSLMVLTRLASTGWSLR